VTKFRYTLSLILLFLIAGQAAGQTGGNNTFEFLNLPASARIAGLGDNYFASKDGDIGLALTNPSMIASDFDNNLSLNFVDYFSDINYGSVMYGNTFNKAGSFVGSLQFIDYGKFIYADETGVTTNSACTFNPLSFAWRATEAALVRSS